MPPPLALSRKAKDRKTNAPSGAEEDTNKCSGRLQQRTGEELNHGTSQECVCHCHWSY